MNPNAGVLIQGTGGIRKLRWAEVVRGKVAVFVLYIISIMKRCRYIC
jgi:hypothetical protein